MILFQVKENINERDKIPRFQPGPRLDTPNSFPDRQARIDGPTAVLTVYPENIKIEKENVREGVGKDYKILSLPKNLSTNLVQKWDEMITLPLRQLHVFIPNTAFKDKGFYKSFDKAKAFLIQNMDKETVYVCFTLNPLSYEKFIHPDDIALIKDSDGYGGFRTISLSDVPQEIQSLFTLARDNEIKNMYIKAPGNDVHISKDRRYLDGLPLSTFTQKGKEQVTLEIVLIFQQQYDVATGTCTYTLYVYTNPASISSDTHSGSKKNHAPR